MKHTHLIAAGIGIIVIAFVSTAYAAAWVGPTALPPGNNVEPPIHSGSAAQVKMGHLTVQGFRSTQNVQFDMNAYANAFLYLSDKTLKKDITPLQNSLSKILQLQGVSFTWKKNGDRTVGLIAQDVEKIYPDIVNTNESGIKSVEYGNLVAPLIEAVKEQQRQIDFLKREIERLESQIRN